MRLYGHPDATMHLILPFAFLMEMYAYLTAHAPQVMSLLPASNHYTLTPGRGPRVR